MISWDIVLHLPAFPRRGGFTPKLQRLERPGGSAANVAQALATAGIETGFVTLLGTDEMGRTLEDVLERSQITHFSIRRIRGESSQVLVLVDDEGERTVVGYAGDELDSLHLDETPLSAGDVVVFVAWSPDFGADLRRAKDAGCTTVVGLGALIDPAVASADLAFGSQADVPPGTDPLDFTDRFGAIVMTNGAAGATYYSDHRVVHQPALPAKVLDTTGAGDAFLAGFLAKYARGTTDPRICLEAGARWSARTVGIEASIPPPWLSPSDLNSPPE